MAWSFSGKQDVYLEIADKLRQYIHAGIWQAGDRLPSVRQAAGEMGVNPNTVARAYALLEEEDMAWPHKQAPGRVEHSTRPGTFLQGSGTYAGLTWPPAARGGRSPPRFAQKP